jgi:uncharacterized membrane protein YcgQ (UPF0703/DUF1980 family)
VTWPDAASLEADRWLEVQGRFEAGDLAGSELPVLVAESLTSVPVPNQPYLYP